MANDYPSRSTGDLMHLGENLIELSSECLILSSPPSKRLCLQRSIKDVTENNDGGTKRYLYFDWKPYGRFESEFANKGEYNFLQHQKYFKSCPQAWRVIRSDIRSHTFAINL